MAAPQKRGVRITYEVVHGLTDLSVNAVHQAGARPKPGKGPRQHLDICSLESVVLWVARHGNIPLRMKICGFAAQSLLDDGVLDGARSMPRCVEKD
jgi:hypothetical protein